MDKKQGKMFGSGDGSSIMNQLLKENEAPKKSTGGLQLKNRAGESRSPYVRGHMNNPVAWQLWGDEAIELAHKENKLLFVSIGYSACHWCHVMERESFENDEIAAILNDKFIPIKIDREERPDIDRIYMNYVQATNGSGGWPLNVFLTPDLEPCFGGTYWPGPNSNMPQGALEEPVDFLGILTKLSNVWREQEDRCRQDAAQILRQLKDFAAEGTYGGRVGEGDDGLDIELADDALSHLSETHDRVNGGFGGAPKFPTPTKLSFLLRINQFPEAVKDIIGDIGCSTALQMALLTLKKMARGGVHDHIGHGFARYSVTADWSLPHFEKMLYDNAQLLNIYLDAFLATSDPEMLGAVYDIATYISEDALAAPSGGFFSAEDADSFYRKGDSEKREGAFYVWTHREFETILGERAAEVCSAFWNVSDDGNVSHANDPQDEFMDQNVLSIVTTPKQLAGQFGMSEEEVVKTIKDSRTKLLEYRNRERPRPLLDDKVVTAWNGMAISSLARTAATISSFDPKRSAQYLEAAEKAAAFIKKNLYDEKDKTLRRVYREGPGDTMGFADDYAFMIEGLIDLYEASFKEDYLEWADLLQKTQINLFHDESPGSGGFYSTPYTAAHTILHLKDGMDTSEPSTNGTSAANLYRLSSILHDDAYSKLAKRTVEAFESEILQYPWLFASFMPAIVAGRLGVRNVVVVGSCDAGQKELARFRTTSRGGLDTLVRVSAAEADAGFLVSRNSLLKGLQGHKVLVCENGACRELGELDLDLESVRAALPTL